MKVSQELVEAMALRIRPHDRISTRDTYRRRDISRADTVTDIDKRYRWDLFYRSGADCLLWADDGSELSDAHIDTALRQIVPPL